MKEHSPLAVDDFVHLPSIYSFYFLNGILIRKICLYLFIDLEITFLLSVMRNLAHLALAGNRRSVSTSTLYIYLLYISMGVELLLIILVRACQSLS